MKILLVLIIAVSGFMSIVDAGFPYITSNDKECSEKCKKYISECYDDCLDYFSCPPKFPVEGRECSPRCIEALSSCVDTCFECLCPSKGDLEHPCYYPDGYIKNEDCCDEEYGLNCSEFYCAGGWEDKWECLNKCNEDEDDCLCPNVKKEETCPGKGIYVENKYCCKNMDSDGCSAWECPGENEPWKCANKC